MEKTTVFRSLLALAVAATMSVGFTSCGEDEVIANPTSVSFDVAGGTQTIQITSNTGWIVGGAPDWLTVFPTQGTENGTITLTAKTNSGDARNCVLYVQAGEASTTISVNQGQGITPPITGTWRANFGSNSWMSFTFNADGTGSYTEYDNGHWDSNNERFSYTYANNIITIYWYENGYIVETETIPVRSLTSTELVMNFDEEGYRTFYKQ